MAKLKVVTQWGTFTRHTNKQYTHVILGKRSEAEVDSLLRINRNDIERQRPLLELVDAQGWYTDGTTSWKPAERIRLAEAQVRALEQQRGKYEALGWSTGERNARRMAQERARYYVDVRMVPVPAL